jgi:hypothetical protein
MELSFGKAEFENWLKFSGQYSPHHFYVGDAKMLGANAPVVHGMLALLSVKKFVSRNCDVALDRAKRWTKFRALFRAPIPHDSTIVLAATSGGPRSHFRGDAKGSAEEYFRGTYCAVIDPIGQIANKDVLAMSETLIAAERWNEFSLSYPDIHDAWIALDAMVFASFIQSKIDSLRERTAVFATQAFGSEGGRVTVQVSHTITYDSSRLSADGLDSLYTSRVAYRVLEPDLIVAPNQLICTIALPVTIGEHVVMLVEIGLLIYS